jgi:predicted  nucleic acid-binding Zn-ribbon protein
MREPALDNLEKEKAALIARFLELQELAEKTNDQIYKLTVEIERLNARIERARQAAPAK